MLQASAGNSGDHGNRSITAATAPRHALCDTCCQVPTSLVRLLQWWPGALSIRDLGADGVGVAAALAVLVAAEARRRPPTGRQQQQQLSESMA